MKFYNKIAFWIVCVWTIIEVVLCIVVLCSYKENKSHAENFLNGLCETEKCGHFIRNALIGRIITSVLLLVGNLLGCTWLMVPWFLVNAMGIFPLLPTIVSSYHTYKDVRDAKTDFTLFYDTLGILLGFKQKDL
ncbi:uncharacterized protein LOC129568166 [Sitodiplosis mosellana]|uniref:uncharacterized protein LOC129568166 n=1 Tax=Sitodiplosis mosellana TaxID=263140 RepID=UPI0024444CC6|nr:uncharacterized protein LOC129568166 [Sitodiplosis mosellana]